MKGIVDVRVRVKLVQNHVIPREGVERPLVVEVYDGSVTDL